MVSLDATRPRVRPHIFSMQRLKVILHSLVLLRGPCTDFERVPVEPPACSKNENGRVPFNATPIAASQNASGINWAVPVEVKAT